MKAAILHPNRRNLSIENIEIPPPKPKEIQIQVKSCGVCGSDVHLVIHGHLKPNQFPCVPGHEVSGIIEKLGEEVTKFKVGDRVVLGAGTSCGRCIHCQSGRENLCSKTGVRGFDSWGGYAEFANADEKDVVRLPETIPFDIGGILADAVSTPYHAVKFRGNLQVGENALVIGSGGLGIHAIAICKSLGASEILVADIDEGSLENAKKFGATECLLLGKGENLGKKIQKMGKTVDIVLDFSGHMETVTSIFRITNRGGRIVLVGIGRSPLEIPIPFYLIERQISILGSYGSDRRALPDLISLVENGDLNLKNSITDILPLEKANEALVHLDEKIGHPIRFVLSP